jgi:hypothetical protein
VREEGMVVFGYLTEGEAAGLMVGVCMRTVTLEVGLGECVWLESNEMQRDSPPSV